MPNVTVNVSTDSDLHLVHFHEEAAVPMTVVATGRDTREKVGPTRLIHSAGLTLECPQCRSRVGVALTTTVDTETTSEDAEITYRVG